MSEKHIYKVAFINQEQVYEVYVKNVYQAELYGFVIVEDFIFGEKSSIVIDPIEEKLRSEFEGVNRSFIPMHNIIRIDQVKKRGTAKIVAISKDAAEDGRLSALYSPDKK
ncbi:DUF1820 family protein [Methylobacter sp. YRD-M1]|uniref:DUF1820 family protein n=1 Tax=Methylobacter sp. YRD-M1 TaxID=2911520 RepID=UPI00227C7F7E|nr:DUF1820 family protein [Methylobacter sp. YRD-M1]WAK01661.1 DUF1820 family protein [Methylobacter sp. YRD-M1]